MRLDHIEIDSRYWWDGTDGFTETLEEPCEVTVVDVVPGAAFDVIVQTDGDVRWHTRAKNVFPLRG